MLYGWAASPVVADSPSAATPSAYPVKAPAQFGTIAIPHPPISLRIYETSSLQLTNPSRFPMGAWPSDKGSSQDYFTLPVDARCPLKSAARTGEIENFGSGCCSCFVLLSRWKHQTNRRHSVWRMSSTRSGYDGDLLPLASFSERLARFARRSSRVGMTVRCSENIWRASMTLG